MSVVAGLATGIGSLISFAAKRDDKRFLSTCLGFSAGVMIYVSFVEMLFKSRDLFVAGFGEKTGGWFVVAAFFGGVLAIALIEKLVPSGEKLLGKSLCSSDKKLMKTGLVTAAALAIHNFPEGLATFVSALAEPKAAIPIAVAIAVHNIPEGIAVAVPVYQATGSKVKAFLWSFLSGLAEPLGALVGFLTLAPVMSDTVFAAVFGGIAGVMAFIAIDELLPTAREGGDLCVTVGLIVGMAVMAVTICAMQ